MKRTIFLITVLLAFFAAGCDDGGKKNNNNNNSNNQNPVCNNGILETGETCDGTELGGATCENINQGFTGGELACAADCTLDTSGCTTACQDACELDNRVCDGNTLRVCETNAETGCTAWVDTDCTASSQSCMIIGGVPQCAACTDACTLNEERCNANADGIETCLLGASGCTEWNNAPCPQATPACELTGGMPTCVATCTDACTLDEKRCNANADGIETCVTGASGCTEWSNTACDAATPTCSTASGAPECVMINGSGDSCSDAYVISVPFYTEGTDFVADFPTADMTFTDATCDPGYDGSGTDAVFALSLHANDAIVFAQAGGLDGQLFIQGVCDAAGTCYDAVDASGSNNTEEILFQAPADGTYYLIVKAYSSNPSTRAYNIGVWAYEDTAELSCGDGFDNDLDDDVDCEDSDCFGIGTCTVETVCDDGADNDNDGSIDCADSDCASIEPCGAENTDARCADGIDNDNDGSIDCDDSDCASATACQSGQSCTNVQTITTFPFHIAGADFTVDFPGNDHTFTGTGCTTGNGAEAVFAVNLLAGQRIRLDEPGSLDAVLRVINPCNNATTCLLSKDYPETNQIFTAPADGTYYVVLEAYSASPTNKDYDFTIDRLPDAETGLCGDSSDNDGDGAIDCADSDCFGDTTFCTTETFCGDGFDNDTDGSTDCADADCAASPACALAESCGNPQVITTFPFHIVGTDFTVDFPGNDHTFTGIGCITGNGAEAVFAVSLLAGERLRLNQTGSLDAVLRVINPCSNATTCLLSQDTPETNILFTAPADGTYYVVLEAYFASPTSKAYDFTIEKFAATETSCSDGVDNDGDGSTDCEDSDCIGNPACPAVVWEENFDGGTLPAFSIVGTVWEMGSVDGSYISGPASCLSPPNCAATRLNGAYDASMAWDSHCIATGDISLSGYTSAQFLFSGWMFGESVYDGGRVQVSSDGGASWQNPATVSPAYNATVGGQSAWVYTDYTWRTYGINLTPYAGSTIRVRFCWRSDSSVQYAGWYIDDLKVLAN